MPSAGRLLRVSVALVVLVLVATSCSYRTRDLVPPVPAVAQTSQILARDGRLILEPPSDENRTIVSIDEIPTVMRDAVVAIEDERFFLHDGVDLKALFRSASRGVTTGGISGGGSTITMQYVGNVFLDRSQQTASRKLEEVLLARQFEKQYSKEFILAEYLNWVYFGARAYGIESAAQQYFDSSVSSLTLPQAALLAGLIQQPSRLNPYNNREGALNRREIVLNAMLRNDFITQDQYLEALDDPLDLAPEFDEIADRYPAGHFVEEVKAWILSGGFMTEQWVQDNPQRAADLATYQAREDLLFRGGIRIRTTVDLDLQSKSEAAIEAILPEGTGKPDAAAVIIDPPTGQILAMVGGRDFFGDSNFANVNLAMGTGRQAGSSMKPILLAAALDRGVSITQRFDAPRVKEFVLPDSDTPWKVRGGSRTGVSNLVDGTIWSRNTVYAQLAIDMGADAVGTMANELGMQADIAPVYAAVLGTENVTTLDLATAYSTFANRGVQHDPIFVTEILNPDGTTLWTHEPVGTRVLETTTTDQLSWVLGEVIARGTGRDADFGRPAAGKTGTAQNYADATFAGYTPDLAAAVWVGFPQGQISMVPCTRKTCTEEDPGTDIQVAGGTYPARIWRELMSVAHARIVPSEFPSPPASAPPTTVVNVPESVDVPDLFGRTVAEAAAQLVDTSLFLSPVEIEDETFTPGTIINQSPPPLTPVPGGTTVIVEVAITPAQPTVPDVIGDDLSTARLKIRREGFTSTRVFVDATGAFTRATDGADAVVVRQDPQPGTIGEAGTKVNIVLQLR
ncbi:MAG: penicillin-binding protein 1A [Verrucomicrobiales bacterium]|jgi:penicillin-binding protein 1A